jgi:CHC2 zinc finger/Toprim domain
LGSRVRIPSPAPKILNENQGLSAPGFDAPPSPDTEQCTKLHEKDGHSGAKSVQCCSVPVRPGSDPPPQKETPPGLGDPSGGLQRTRAKASTRLNTSPPRILQARLSDADIDRARAVPIERELERRGVRLQRHGPEYTGPCPKCGCGTDRFSINVQKQVWNCRRCEQGGHDAISLVMHLDGLDFADAVELLAGITPTHAPRPQVGTNNRVTKIDDDAKHKRDLALRIWREADDPRETLAQAYLKNRDLDLPDEAANEAIRFHGRCAFGSPGSLFPDWFPAMVCLVRDIETNRPIAIQRTALKVDGKAIKRNGKTLRMTLGPIKGGAIKLDPDENVTQGLCIGEGVETCLTGRQRGYRPVWAAISAGGIAAFPVLPGIDALTIHGEADDANAKVEACRKRWSDAGREVILCHSMIGSDLNDVIRGRAAS